ncbi:hypothetical protein Jiend_00090 [Micromonospora endophytica]|nr:hypothetical protein Jiend_00090 [Micromonospora endophytica]
MAGVPLIFPARGAVVAVSAGSLMCPPGWIGIVALGDAAISTVPTDRLQQSVRAALAALPLPAVTDPARLAAVLPVEDVLGPATLAYCDERYFPPQRPGVTEKVPGGHRELADFLASVPASDAEECGLAEITSSAFVVRAGGRVVAAAGYRHWPAQVAQVSVVTTPDRRGRGLARLAAGAAVADSLTNRLLPQWRARSEASRRVARALGFRELGTQVSVRVGTTRPSAGADIGKVGPPVD